MIDPFTLHPWAFPAVCLSIAVGCGIGFVRVWRQPAAAKEQVQDKADPA